MGMWNVPRFDAILLFYALLSFWSIMGEFVFSESFAFIQKDKICVQQTFLILFYHYCFFLC